MTQPQSRWRDLPASFAAVAALGLLTAGAAYQITGDRIEWHCASEACTNRFTTGRTVFVVATFLTPAIAVLLVFVSAKDRRRWSRIGWLVFTTMLLAIVAYGLWVNAPNENVTL